MNIVERNFFRLLRAGVFEAQETIEPMSAWKWERVLQMAITHGVAALAYDGIRRCSDQFFMQIADDEQRAAWTKIAKHTEDENQKVNMCISEVLIYLNDQHLRPILLKGQSLATYYPVPNHRKAGDIDIFFPFEPQAKKADEWAKMQDEDADTSEKHLLRYHWRGIKVEHHRRMICLTNTLLNRRLQSIIEGETRACDSVYVIINGTRTETVPPTLNMLYILLRISHFMLNEGLRLKQLLDLGIFLRKMGHKVDFVKVEEWIEQLKLKRMAQLAGALLVRLFNFSEDEIPFMEPDVDDKKLDDIYNEIVRLRTTHDKEWYFSQGNDIFVHTANSSAMFWHVRHSAKYFKYYPSETVTNLFASFAHSLSHIEE